MPKTSQRQIEPKQYLDFGVTKTQVHDGSGVCTHVNGEVKGAVGAGTYYIQLWDGDPASGGTLRWFVGVEHDGTNDTRFGPDELPDIGVYCAESIYVTISDEPDSQSGSKTADFAVSYQKD